jgi:hypothetical protein
VSQGLSCVEAVRTHRGRRWDPRTSCSCSCLPLTGRYLQQKCQQHDVCLSCHTSSYRLAASVQVSRVCYRGETAVTASTTMPCILLIVCRTRTVTKLSDTLIRSQRVTEYSPKLSDTRAGIAQSV